MTEKINNISHTTLNASTRTDSWKDNSLTLYIIILIKLLMRDDIQLEAKLSKRKNGANKLQIKTMIPNRRQIFLESI